VIQEHIDAGISLCDAVNFIVEKYDLVRTIVPVSAQKHSRRLSAVSIFSAPAKPPG
jgi:cytoskeleton-binding toxin CbtA-like protein